VVVRILSPSQGRLVPIISAYRGYARDPRNADLERSASNLVFKEVSPNIGLSITSEPVMIVKKTRTLSKGKENSARKDLSIRRAEAVCRQIPVL